MTRLERLQSGIPLPTNNIQFQTALNKKYLTSVQNSIPQTAFGFLTNLYPHKQEQQSQAITSTPAYQQSNFEK